MRKRGNSQRFDTSRRSDFGRTQSCPWTEQSINTAQSYLSWSNAETQQSLAVARPNRSSDGEGHFHAFPLDESLMDFALHPWQLYVAWGQIIEPMSKLLENPAFTRPSTMNLGRRPMT